MRSLCGSTATIHRMPTGAPRWPVGLVGSMSHSPAFCVAACGYESGYLGLGVDTEVASDVPSSLLSYVASPSELLAGEPAHRLFSVKEAIFKAINPIRGDWLEFSDVTVGFDRDEWRAEVRGFCVTGRCLSYRGSVLSPAWIDAPDH
jgi:4'-phosphopantetheinyl transferase EntD